MTEEKELIEQPKDYPDKIRVAVYGSLKRGFGNNRILSDTRSQFLGIGETPPDYTMIHLGGFPGLIKGNQPVHVEVYEVSEDTFLNRLDRLEGYPTFYNRELITIKMDSGWSTTAWIYHLKDGRRYDTYPRVEDVDDKNRQFWKRTQFR